MAGNTNIVVIGGGYAGVMAANRLTQHDKLTVTLINPRPEFVERMRLHQRVAGTHDARTGFENVLADRVRLVINTVTRIDPSARRVHLETEDTISYDYLVYAVGSGDDLPELAELAYPMSTLEDATKLRTMIDALPATVPLTIVGAGLTGIETAAELADAGRKVTLVCGNQLCPYLHPRARTSVARELSRLGVTLIEGSGAKVAGVTHSAVHLEDDRTIPSALSIWTAGFAVPDLAARSGLSTDSIGRLLTDESLTAVSDDRIIAAGDAASPSGHPYRMSAYTATRLGAHAADTVLRRVAGLEPKPINLGFFGVCIGLGRRMATLQVARKDDTTNGITLSGRMVALLVKEAGTKGVIAHMAREAHNPGAHTLRRKDPSRPHRIATCGRMLPTAKQVTLAKRSMP